MTICHVCQDLQVVLHEDPVDLPIERILQDLFLSDDEHHAIGASEQVSKNY